MDSGALIVMILALLALIGVVVFFVYDFLKHKDANIKEFSDTKALIETESSDRLSNLKYVVDQVNEVNTDIYNTMTSNIQSVNTSTSNISKTQTSILGGLDKFLRFTSNSIPGAPTVSLVDLPGTRSPDVQLIQHVTALMGITVKDLSSTNKMEMCNRDRTKCIEIPDSNGNTVLRSMTAGTGRVIVDDPLQVRGELRLGANSVIGSDGTNIFLQGSNVGVGNGFTNPQAKLHIKTELNQDPFKITLASSDAILVSADGSLVTTKPIVMRSGLNDVNNVARLSIETDSTNNTKFVKLETNRLHVQGDMSVSGRATVNGQAIQTVAPSV